MNEQDLLKAGFRQQPDGSWSKRPVPMAQLQSPERKSDSREALDGGTAAEESGPESVVVSIIGCRKRILDSDNFISGAKALRDIIAGRLGLDDADPRITWEYGQQHTHGPEGTIVLISL